MIKIRSKINLCPDSHFTENLVDAFGKSPWEYNLNHETFNLLIRWFKSYTDISLQQSTTTPYTFAPKSMLFEQPINRWQLNTPALRRTRQRLRTVTGTAARTPVDEGLVENLKQLQLIRGSHRSAGKIYLRTILLQWTWYSLTRKQDNRRSHARDWKGKIPTGANSRRTAWAVAETRRCHWAAGGNHSRKPESRTKKMETLVADLLQEALAGNFWQHQKARNRNRSSV
jgi:hypothetical protein